MCRKQTTPSFVADRGLRVPEADHAFLDLDCSVERRLLDHVEQLLADRVLRLPPDENTSGISRLYTDLMSFAYSRYFPERAPEPQARLAFFLREEKPQTIGQ